jgi:hypothetical protein
MSRETIESNTPAEGLEILDDLIGRYYKKLLKNIDENLKPGDLLKMIELRHKLARTGAEQEKFWAMLSRIRRDTLNRPLADAGGSIEKPKEQKGPHLRLGARSGE